MNTLDDNLENALSRFGINKETILNRHLSTQHMLKVLAPNPKLPAESFAIADRFFGLALGMINLGDGPELTAGLRKLLEAKDCFVRAAIDSDPVNYNDR